MFSTTLPNVGDFILYSGGRIEIVLGVTTNKKFYSYRLAGENAHKDSQIMFIHSCEGEILSPNKILRLLYD